MIAIQFTELIKKDDPRGSSTEIKLAIKEKVKYLLQLGTLKLELKEEIPDDANFLTVHFLLSIKSNDDC